MALELNLEPIQAPSEIRFNYEELKTQLASMAAEYKGLVFTESQLPEAKKDRASLNKMKKALNDARIQTQREYMAPFDEFKTKIDDLIKLVDEPVKEIDVQIKGFEEAAKEEKKEEIRKLFAETGFQAFVTLEMIWNEKWMNKSYSLKQISEEMTLLLNKIGTEVYTIHSLEAFSFEAMEVYKETLDLNRAIAEGQRLADIQKRKEEEAARRAEEARAKEEAEKAKAQAAATEALEEAEPEPCTPIRPEPEPEHWQEKTVTFRITARYEQKEILNELFRKLNTEGIKYEVMGSEER
jgi:septal ring factor EnvC (AmiA/AmiB activator)